MADIKHTDAGRLANVEVPGMWKYKMSASHHSWAINYYLNYTHTRLMALCPGLPGWASTRKVKPIWILVKQETASGSGISWAICKSASRSRQITMPAPHCSSFFTGRMPFLPPNQQRQSTEGKEYNITNAYKSLYQTFFQLSPKSPQRFL